MSHASHLDEDTAPAAPPAERIWPGWLTRRWSVPALVLLGMLLVMPAINSGLAMDDFLHWSTLMEGARTSVHPGSPWGMFHFLTGDVAHNQALKATGELMWWTADDLRTSFWRPLSEVTHWLDYQLWPHSPALMHLHSVLWYGALVFLVAWLHQRLDPASPGRARLTTLLFATGTLHLSAAVWIAARNQLVAACFMVACIGAFHLWRMRGGHARRWLAVGLFALALLSAEAGLATLGYLVAHTLVYRPNEAPLPRRAAGMLSALLPFVIIAVLWRIGYTAMGYGSSGSGFYVDPADDVVRFLGAVLVRIPALLLAELLGISTASLALMSTSQQALYAAAATGMIAAVWLVARSYGLWARPLARFLGLGALLALLPMCASEPADRLLLSAEVGLSGLLAMLLTQVLATHRLHRGWLAGAAKVFVGVIMLVHLVVFPILMAGSAAARKHMVMPAHLDALSLPDAGAFPAERMVLLNPPVASMAVYYPAVRRYHGVANPESIHALAHGLQNLKLSVLDPHTLVLHAPEGESFFDKFSRDVRTRPFKVGEVIHAGGMQAVVTALSPKGMPVTVRFHFDEPITQGHWRFYAWTETGYLPYTLPAPGQTVVLPAHDLAGIAKRQLRGEIRHSARPLFSQHGAW